MCRSIKTLFNFDPPATDEEIHAAALQFVRKLSGFNMPSKVNEAAFGDTVDEVFEVARRLINRLETVASRRNQRKKPKRRDSVRPSGFGDQLRLEVERLRRWKGRDAGSSKPGPPLQARPSPGGPLPHTAPCRSAELDQRAASQMTGASVQDLSVRSTAWLSCTRATGKLRVIPQRSAAGRARRALHAVSAAT